MSQKNKELSDIIHRIGLQNRTPVSVEITITNRCNCNCDYCFETNHCDISSLKQENKQILLLKKYCEDFDLSKHNNLNIVFWGGEPMMNTDFMYRIIRETEKYDFVTYMMYSNGILIEKYKDFLQQDFIESIKNRFQIQLSYDGEPHHKIKRHSDSNLIMEVAKLLNEKGFSFSFKATLSMDSFDLLPEIWDSYEKLHSVYSFVRYSPTIDQTNLNNNDENFEKWKKSLDVILKKEYNFISTHGYPLWNWFSNIGKLHCNLNNSVSLHCDGNFYVCHGCHFLKNKECFKLGSVEDTNDIENVLNKKFNTKLKHKKCVDCSAVVCAVCHVSELDGDYDKSKNYVDNWARVVPNSFNRCKYFKYFGFIYHILNMYIINSITK